MTLLSDIQLIRPYWLLALLPLAVVLVLLWRKRTGAAIWRTVVDAHLLPHLLQNETGRPRRLPLILLALGWIILVIALAGPVWEKLPQPVFTTTSEGAILLDLSPSMNAADRSPSRLARARFEILDLLRATEQGQVALLAFGPEPFIVSPLSGDARTIAAQVPQLTTDLIPVPGPRRTDLALEAAGEMLDQARAHHADLILVTDGVGELAGSLAAARTLAERGHRLSILAVGTAKGAPVPSASGGFMQNDDGAIEIAQLDRDALQALAKAGNGRYVEAVVGDRDTKALTSVATRLDERVEQTALSADTWREEGPWLLLVLLPLAALAFRRGWLLPVFAVVLILPTDPSQAFDWSDLWLRADQQAQRQLEAGQAEEAAERFQNPAWRAAANYRAGAFDKALENLTGLEGADADFNRGNALARLGRLEDAVDAYTDALKQSPDHADAQHNRDLVQALLEQQQEQQPDQEQHDQESSSDRQESTDRKDESSEQDQNGDSNQDATAGQDASTDDSGNGEPGSGQTQQQSPDSNPSSETVDAHSDTESATERSNTAPNPPDEHDFGPDALSADVSPTAPQQGADADRKSLMHGVAETAPEDGAGQGAPASESRSPEERERQQAIDAQLRRVPDDPAGLIRQRFLLQHLRREGRLP